LRRVASVCVSCVVLAALAGARPAGAGEPDPDVVQQILEVLQQRGLLEQGQYEALSARYAASEKDRASWLPKLHFYGDARIRGEGFWYDQDPMGNTQKNRTRARYRLRIGTWTDINDWVRADFRLASGTGDNRSTNVTLGNSPYDFAPDQIWIDRAYLDVHVPDARMPVEGGTASLDLGKVPNPFVWKAAPDIMLWDNDINPEGFALRLGGDPAQGLSLFANAGYFIDQENSTSIDPHLIAVQAGGSFAAPGHLVVGGRASWYGFRSVTPAFVSRGVSSSLSAGDATDGGGNIAGGLTNGNDTINVGEFGAYLTWNGVESWPVTLWGDLSSNFSARSTPGTGPEDLAWGAGVVVGDKKRTVALGGGYWAIQADAFPSQFIDSDLFDGYTNRKGFAVWGTRTILPGTDVQITLFRSHAIDTGLPSAQNSDRIRVQTDLVVGF
jgi:hypothetical protein